MKEGTRVVRQSSLPETVDPIRLRLPTIPRVPIPPFYCEFGPGLGGGGSSAAGELPPHNRAAATCNYPALSRVAHFGQICDGRLCPRPARCCWSKMIRTMRIYLNAASSES